MDERTVPIEDSGRKRVGTGASGHDERTVDQRGVWVKTAGGPQTISTFPFRPRCRRFRLAPPRRSKLNENPSIGDAFGKNTADLAGACIHCLSFKTVGRKGCHQPIAHSSLIQAFL